jgi:hypothetical protein
MGVTSIGWRLAEMAARFLGAEERDAALGDMVETGENGAGALRSVLGLVARRQIEAFGDWMAWIALLCIALPLGVMLTLIGRTISDHVATYLWLYVDKWSPMFLSKATFRRDLIGDILGFLLSSCILAGNAWSGGITIGMLSLRAGAVPLNAAMYLAAGLTAELACLGFGRSSAASGKMFYNIVLPVVAQVALVLLPAWSGLRQSMNVGEFSRSKVIRTAVMIALAAVSFQVWLWTDPAPWTAMWNHAPGSILRFVPFFWGWAYMIANAITRRRDSRLKENHS